MHTQLQWSNKVAVLRVKAKPREAKPGRNGRDKGALFLNIRSHKVTYFWIGTPVGFIKQRKVRDTEEQTGGYCPW